MTNNIILLRLFLFVYYYSASRWLTYYTIILLKHLYRYQYLYRYDIKVINSKKYKIFPLYNVITNPNYKLKLCDKTSEICNMMYRVKVPYCRNLYSNNDKKKKKKR